MNTNQSKEESAKEEVTEAVDLVKAASKAASKAAKRPVLTNSQKEILQKEDTTLFFAKQKVSIKVGDLDNQNTQQLLLVLVKPELSSFSDKIVVSGFSSVVLEELICSGSEVIQQMLHVTQDLGFTEVTKALEGLCTDAENELTDLLVSWYADWISVLPEETVSFEITVGYLVNEILKL